MKREHLKVLERISTITGIPLSTLEEKFIPLSHNDKRSIIYDLRVVLRSYSKTPNKELADWAKKLIDEQR